MLQIIGTKKNILTKKALRYCAERSIEHQFVDLHQRDLSEGEWAKIFARIDCTDLIDTDSALYKKAGYAYREFDPREELVEHPQLLSLPLLKQKDRVYLVKTVKDLDLIGDLV
ncbi:MAG: hypothetical protein PQJ47_05895 [Sphaerochaetaceae bacterium]|nr:hypothetical protein [Sphaerochaetaceae bacterium]